MKNNVNGKVIDHSALLPIGVVASVIGAVAWLSWTAADKHASLLARLGLIELRLERIEQAVENLEH